MLLFQLVCIALIGAFLLGIIQQSSQHHQYFPPLLMMIHRQSQVASSIPVSMQTLLNELCRDLHCQGLYVNQLSTTWNQEPWNVETIYRSMVIKQAVTIQWNKHIFHLEPGNIWTVPRLCDLSLIPHLECESIIDWRLYPFRRNYFVAHEYSSHLMTRWKKQSMHFLDRIIK